MNLLTYVVTTAIITWGASQILKALLNCVGKKKKFCYWQIFADGDYPSTHTAFVTSVTTMSWIYTINQYIKLGGFTDQVWVSIALTVLFAVVVRDAVGVRYTVQKLCDSVVKLAEDTKCAEELKQKLNIRSGHRKSEVLAGAILGGIIAGIMSAAYYDWPTVLVLMLFLLGGYISVSFLIRMK